ncbi:hypothetical protein HAX54_002598, partial [Datura stramonium]|nr:hypothetical protein [Datura stramonium]
RHVKERPINNAKIRGFSGHRVQLLRLVTCQGKGWLVTVKDFFGSIHSGASKAIFGDVQPTQVSARAVKHIFLATSRNTKLIACLSRHVRGACRRACASFETKMTLGNGYLGSHIDEERRKL